MEEKVIVATGRRGLNLFYGVLYILLASVVALLTVGEYNIIIVTGIELIDHYILMFWTLFFLGLSIYSFLKYKNKRLIINEQEIRCINSLGQERRYFVTQVKYVEAGVAVYILFEDEYKLKVKKSYKTSVFYSSFFGR